MLDTILNVLKQSSADAWSVKDLTKEGFEFYMIRHQLDQNRVVNTKHYIVTVYKSIEDGKYLGNASGEIAPTATVDEVKEKIDTLIHQATLVKNKPYTLNEPVECKSHASEEIDLAKISKDFLITMDSLEETKTEDLNSYEIFVSKNIEHYVSSTGVDVTSTYPKSLVEVVVNARKDEHEIELYRMYTSGTCDQKTLSFDVNETLKYGKDKLVAKDTPNFKKMDVVFSTDASLQIYNWVIDRMNVTYKYLGYSDLELNEPIAKDVVGDQMTIRTVTTLINSSENGEFDGEGAKRRDMDIVVDGVAKNYHGVKQYSDYLGVKDSFIAKNFVVSGGSKSMDELRTGPYVEIVEFSDFQVSPFNGDIAGEIRLGYYNDGTSITPISGGSVSGSMNDFVKDMYMSKETRQYDTMVVPMVTKLKDVILTGAE